MVGIIKIFYREVCKKLPGHVARHAAGRPESIGFVNFSLASLASSCVILPWHGLDECESSSSHETVICTIKYKLSPAISDLVVFSLQHTFHLFHFFRYKTLLKTNEERSSFTGFAGRIANKFLLYPTLETEWSSAKLKKLPLWPTPTDFFLLLKSDVS